MHNFHREYFVGYVIDIQWINRKYNAADAISAAFGTTNFHTYMNKAIELRRCMIDW